MAARTSTWALGFTDEVWWSRFAAPRMATWQGDDTPVRLVAQRRSKDDPDPIALACYGMLVRHTAPDGALPPPDQMLLRFVDGRPVSAVTTDFLAWCSDQLLARDKTVLVLIWDNASWHVSKAVRAWVRQHNRQVKAGQRRGVRISMCCLPSKSPWLNPIEPQWMHGKRAVVEPDRQLTAQELADRVCAYYGCCHESHLVQSQKAA